MILSGAADRFNFTDAELSVCCASHAGAHYHIETVQGILAKAGVTEKDLACGTHAPGDEAERQRLQREGLSPSPVHNNCSGKHAGMLAASVALGAPVAGYLEADHPVQQHIRRVLTQVSGVPESQFVTSTDGCGAPTVALPLQIMALTFARLANPAGLPDDYRAACDRIEAAMASAPEMVSHTNAFNTRLLKAGQGRLVAKGGAEGLMLIGVKDSRQLGIAFKIADGSFRPQGSIALRALRLSRAVGEAVLAELAEFSRPAITNCHSDTVGHIEADFTLDC